MPTTAKLVSAIYFALLAWVVAELYMPGLPEGTQVGLLRPVASAVGAFTGWRVSGRLVGRGYVDAAGNGLRSVVSTAVMVTLIFSIYEMLRQSTRLRYDGVMEALLGAMSLFLDFARLMLTPQVLGVALIGGIIGGLIAEWVSRRWG